MLKKKKMPQFDQSIFFLEIFWFFFFTVIFNILFLRYMKTFSQLKYFFIVRYFNVILKSSINIKWDLINTINYYNSIFFWETNLNISKDNLFFNSNVMKNNNFSIFKKFYLKMFN